MLDHFKEILGEERHNQLLQEAEGKTYEELLNERNELQARVEELEEEAKRLNEELEESRECEDPVLRAHKNFSETISSIITPKNIVIARVEREHREGIPLDDEGMPIDDFQVRRVKNKWLKK